MRPAKPRVTPLEPAEWNDEQRVLMAPFVESGTAWNVFKTLLRHTRLFKRWMPFAAHVLSKQTLSLRERELLILRIGWLCRAGYEWGQHVVIARQSGVSEAEIERVADGPDAPGWSDADRALLRAVDELRADAFITDPTWSALAKHFSKEQVLDLIFAVGQYQLVSMALNSLGVQPDSPDLPTLPVR